MHFRSLAVLGAACAAIVLGQASPAEAKCKKLGFSVNDYGKEGPTKDAKSLLDKFIGDWAKQRGIAKYTVGKKDVKCELFLNFIVFDEHTCEASATVCWGDGPGAPGATPASSTPVPAPAAPAVKPPSAKKAQVPE